MTATAYEQLEKHFEKIYELKGALSMLSWDQACMMPDGASDSRARHLAALEGVVHSHYADPKIGEWLNAAENEKNLGPWQATNLKKMRHQWLHQTALHQDLVEQFSKASSECEMVWRKAKQNNDFKALKPFLKRVIDLTREIAKIKSDCLECSPYDALIDSWEGGFKNDEIRPIFSDLENFIKDLLPKVMDKQAKLGPVLSLGNHFDIEKQQILAENLARRLGFDFNHGRLDRSAHPFCGGISSDVRITTRYFEDTFIPSMAALLHETGHGLYEQGLPQQWQYQPVGQALGMDFHESQSLFMEMQICRSEEFMTFVIPLLKRTFDGRGPAWEHDNIIRFCNRVEPSFIRVNADEVTYPAHIILRYNLENAIIDGDLDLDDVPQAWNEGMRDLLGIVPPTDSLGCIQDIHWMIGGFGYFANYTFGALIAAQLFKALKRDHPDIMTHIKNGDFSTLLQWLRRNLHQQGSLYSVQELLVKVTGETLNPEIFKQHLVTRYLDSEIGKIKDRVA